MTTPGDLGSARGRITIDTSPALRALARLRHDNASTVGALRTTGRAGITAGTGIMAVGAGIVGVFALAVKKTAELDRQISYIAGITKLTADEQAKLRAKVVQLGQDSAYTAQQVAVGFTELAKAGATPTQMVGGLGDAMITLGQASDIALDKAAASLVSISSTFHLLPKDAAHIADVIQGAANASIISVDDMATSFKYVGGVAAALGISFEDTATALSELGNYGIKGSTAGTALRRMLLQLTPRTKKAADAMKQLGIITKDGSNQFFDAKGKAKSLGKIFEILHKATAKLTPKKRQDLLATIFGDRAIASVLDFTRGGAAEFEKFYAAIGNTKAADVAAKRLDNLAGAWEILKGTIDSALINAASPANQVLKDMVRWVTRLINRFNALPKETQKNIVKFTLLGAGLFLVVGGLTAMLGVIARAIAVTRELRGAFLALKTVLFGEAAAKDAGVIRTIFKLGARGVTSPVGLAILAIAALAGIFIYAYKHSQKFRDEVHRLWNNLKELGEGVARRVTPILKDLQDRFTKLYENVKRRLTPVFDRLRGIVEDHLVKAFDRIRDSLSDAKKNFIDAAHHFNEALGGKKDGTEKLQEFIDALFKLAENTAVVQLATLMYGIAGGINAIAAAAAWAAGALDDFSKALDRASKMTSGSMDAFRAARDQIAAIFADPRPFIVAIATSLTVAISRIPLYTVRALGTVLGATITALVDFYKKVLTTASPSVRTAAVILGIHIARAVIHGIESIFSAIGDFWKWMIDTLTGGGDKNAEKQKAEFRNQGASFSWKFLQGIANPLAFLPQYFTDAIKAAILEMAKMAGRIYEMGEQVALNFVKGLAHGFHLHLPSIPNPFGGGGGDDKKPKPGGVGTAPPPKVVAPTVAPDPNAKGTTPKNALGLQQSRYNATAGSTTVIKNYSATVNNPKAEQASTDLPRVLRSIDYVAG